MYSVVKSHCDLSVLAVSLMVFKQTKIWIGFQFFGDFWRFCNFAKPLRNSYNNICVMEYIDKSVLHFLFNVDANKEYLKYNTLPSSHKRITLANLHHVFKLRFSMKLPSFSAIYVGVKLCRNPNPCTLLE